MLVGGFRMLAKELASRAGAAPFAMAVRGKATSVLESSSSKIFKQSKANKEGLSFALDATLRDGSHDMRVFGLGFLRSLASPAAYGHFSSSMYFGYKAMEDEFDNIVKSDDQTNPSAMAVVWKAFPELRRTPGLEKDLIQMGLQPDQLTMSPATLDYVNSIKHAGADKKDLLLGHFYCRYFADLFGGSMLGYPTQVAMGMPDKPEFYEFGPKVNLDRRAYIESVYAKLNEVGAGLTKEMEQLVVEEAKLAFRHNAAVYSEVCPDVLPSMNVGAVLGAIRIATGSVRNLVLPYKNSTSA